MSLQLIGVIYQDSSFTNIVGFRLLNTESHKVLQGPYNAALDMVRKNQTIVGLCIEQGKLKGSNGSLDRYPKIDGSTNKITNKTLIILNSIDDIGYRVSDVQGKILDKTAESLLPTAKKAGLANGKIIEKDNKVYISSISGVYTNIPVGATTLKRKSASEAISNATTTVNEPAKKLNSAVKSVKASNVQQTPAAEVKKVLKKTYDTNLRNLDDPRFPKVVYPFKGEESYQKLVDPLTGLTVEEKLVYTGVALRECMPLYYSIYTILNKCENDSIKTMGVSLDTMYFNPHFVLDLPLSQLLFVVLHEISHIAMMHRVREKGREHDLWNVACDYYINKSLAEQYEMEKKDTPIKVNKPCRPGETPKQSNYTIELPSWVLFNPKINTDKDTPESIYAELSELASQMPNNQSPNGEQGEDGDDSESSDSSNRQGSSTKGNGDNKGKNGQSSDSGNEPNDEGNEQSENEQSSGSGSNDKKKSKDEQSGNEQSSGSESSNTKNSEDGNGSEGNGVDKQSDDKSNKQPGRLVGKMYRGKKIQDYESDIVDDESSKNKDESIAEQSSRSLLSRAVTMYRQTHQWGGDSADFLERFVADALAPKVNWRALLKNKLNMANIKVNTFTAPDRRFISRGMTLPGPRNMEDNALKNIKICIDTSGSISDEDLGIAFSQIKQLFRTYKAEAELLYWDTRVRAVYPFNKVDDLVKCKPMGGGGTDAECIFEYFENQKEYKLGIKPKPSIIIVFTDGYFGPIDNKYKQKYRNTIWIIKDNKHFTAPFGSKADF